jgi:tripartite-type tricarboxylate transporter receptor subunit TctC
MKTIFLLVLAAIGGLLHAPAAAAPWPERTVKFVVPFPPGGPADGSMRIVTKRLTELWGQPVIVENKAGAHGTVAVATAPPDGYTLLLSAGSGMVTAPLMNKKLTYKPADFAPVSLLGTSSSILTTHPGTAMKTVKDLLAQARAHPGALSYGSAGIGSPGHLVMEMFQQRTGTKMTHIPYRGGSPVVTDLMGGVVQLAVNATPTTIPHLQSGKLVALAVTSRKRDRALPDVPTLAEAGVPNLEFDVWYGIFAPAKTPAAIVDKIGADLRKVLAEAETQKLFHAQGNEAAGTTPAQLGRMVQEETQAWSKLIKERNLTLEE